MAKRKRRPRQRAASVQPGIVGPPRPVPRGIVRPAYARDARGEPGPSRMAPVRSTGEIEAMRRAGAAAAEVLMIAGRHVTPGTTTDAIDAVVHAEVLDRGAYPSPLGYRTFPKSVCTSVNEVICHGIPDSRPLAAGDIVNIDVTVYLDGVHGDTSAMFCVGEVDAESERLVRGTLRALEAAIGVVAPGVPVSAIGEAIEGVARPLRLGVVREFVGHGVGPDFHGSLQIPHYYDPRNSVPLAVGMTFTIEPMLTLGGPQVDLWSDGWTAVTADRSRSAQFEHTLAVTSDGAEVLTTTSDGRCAHELSAASVPGRGSG
ncbi:MAG: type I methionyl aminopeptidase [bacterium]|nr:type I methionyl aminopeptidase [bacterium]